MSKIVSYDCKFIVEFDSWIFYVNDVMVHETKSESLSRQFKDNMKNLIGCEVHSLDGPVDNSLFINGIPLFENIDDNSLLERLKDRLKYIFPIPLILKE